MYRGCRYYSSDPQRFLTAVLPSDNGEGGVSLARLGHHSSKGYKEHSDRIRWRGGGGDIMIFISSREHFVSIEKSTER